MEMCWRYDPEGRPKFTQLLNYVNEAASDIVSTPILRPVSKLQEQITASDFANSNPATVPLAERPHLMAAYQRREESLVEMPRKLEVYSSGNSVTENQSPSFSPCTTDLRLCQYESSYIPLSETCKNRKMEASQSAENESIGGTREMSDMIV